MRFTSTAGLLFLTLMPVLYGRVQREETEEVAEPHLVRFQAPPPLSFNELVLAATADPPPAGLQEKLDTLLSAPFVSNEATLAGMKPKTHSDARMGRVISIVEWNINRGENQERVRKALTGSGISGPTDNVNGHRGRKRLRKIREELRVLSSADVIVLDEVDDGVKRTNYRNVARDLAQALGMNYAYGVEFVELDRIYLGARKMDVVDVPRQHQTAETYGVDPKRCLGLEGSAILSRYPIRNARIVRLPQAYDWYHSEATAISDLERARRWSAERLFQERIRRQVRRGGRMALIAELAVPESPTGILTIVAPHLEDYSPPTGRREQMNALLNSLRAETNPLVIAGDLNTTGHNGTPVTVKRLLLNYLVDYRFWVRQAFYFFVPAPGLGYFLRGINYFKNFHDPTAIDIPFFADNREKQLFKDTKNFRFDDGGSLSFDGLSKRSFHHKGRTLANSNQRAWKGFATTFSFARTYHGLVGKYKVDWFFVKPKKKTFLPYSGRTLREMNRTRISDHAPIVIDLLLDAPTKTK
jgi:endonuclease/exonuclease/phosphatase family metal-dependent hydrolase